MFDEEGVAWAIEKLDSFYRWLEEGCGRNAGDVRGCVDYGDFDRRGRGRDVEGWSGESGLEGGLIGHCGTAEFTILGLCLSGRGKFEFCYR